MPIGYHQFNPQLVLEAVGFGYTFLLTFPKRMAEVPDARVLDRGTTLTC